jgi:TRAP-type mannitol/chloroaromatic compound transport system permease large subunit
MQKSFEFGSLFFSGLVLKLEGGSLKLLIVTATTTMFQWFFTTTMNMAFVVVTMFAHFVYLFSLNN